MYPEQGPRFIAHRKGGVAKRLHANCRHVEAVGEAAHGRADACVRGAAHARRPLSDWEAKHYERLERARRRQAEVHHIMSAYDGERGYNKSACNRKRALVLS